MVIDFHDGNDDDDDSHNENDEDDDDDDDDEDDEDDDDNGEDTFPAEAGFPPSPPDLTSPLLPHILKFR